MSKELIFVYNADSGKWNNLLDAMHKVISPATYSCNLCAVTYGTFTVRKAWKVFIEQLPIRVRFLYRDEWEKEFERKDQLPAVFLRQNDQVSSWIDAYAMNDFDLEDLKNHITGRIQELTAR